MDDQDQGGVGSDQVVGSLRPLFFIFYVVVHFVGWALFLPYIILGFAVFIL